MAPIKKTATLVLVIFFILLFSSLFTVSEGEKGLLLRLGRLVNDGGNQVKTFLPGLHIKMPFIETLRLFDARLQTLDIKSSRIMTKEKKDVIVDYYVKWRIEDLARYFKSTGGNALKAETLLEQQINTSLRAQFGKRNISELVTGGRDDLMALLRMNAEQQAAGLGVHVVDVRIKGIEFPPTTSQAIYQRMRSQMQAIANRQRADGQATAEAIQAGADAKVTILLATAKSQGQEIRARGDAEAAKIYAEAFNQNKSFSAFYLSLKAYEASFNSKKDLLILDQSSDFFQYFKHGLMNYNEGKQGS